jgi:hypothetical protein
MKRVEDVLVETAAGAKALEQDSKVVKIRRIEFMVAVVGSESVVKLQSSRATSGSM